MIFVIYFVIKLFISTIMSLVERQNRTIIKKLEINSRKKSEAEGTRKQKVN